MSLHARSYTQPKSVMTDVTISRLVKPNSGDIITECAPLDEVVFAEVAATVQHPKLRQTDFMRYVDDKGTLDVEETLRLLSLELERRGQLGRWGRLIDVYKKHVSIKGVERLHAFIAFDDGTSSTDKQISDVCGSINKTCSKPPAVIYFKQLSALYGHKDARVIHTAPNMLLALQLNHPAQSYDALRYVGNNHRSGKPSCDLYEVRCASDGVWSNPLSSNQCRQGQAPFYEHGTAQHARALAAIEAHPDREFVRWHDDDIHPKVATRCLVHDLENVSHICAKSLLNLNCRECLLEQGGQLFDWAMKLERMIKLYTITGVDVTDDCGVYVLSHPATFKIGITNDYVKRGYAKFFEAIRSYHSTRLHVLLIEQLLLRLLDQEGAVQLHPAALQHELPDLGGYSETFLCPQLMEKVCDRFDALVCLDVDTLITMYTEE